MSNITNKKTNNAVNISKLRGAIFEKYKNLSVLSQELKWYPNKISRILNGQYIPNVDDCSQLSGKLNLDSNTFMQIFLPNLSPNGDK